MTLLASLVAVAIASAIFFLVSERERDTSWSGRRDHFIAALLPAGSDAATLQSTLDRLGRAFDADISVFEADGRLIASTGRPFPPDVTDPARRGDGLRHGFVTTLEDGRLVAARTDGPSGSAGRNPLAYLVMIAAVIGLAAYPVVRHLTRRLEQLRKGVEAWGAGALDTRVPEKGTDEVATVAKTFNEAADRVERLVTAHRSLLANASHELRSPIARLRMAIDLHEKQGDEGSRQEIIRNLTEVDRLVEEILLASRLDHVGLAGSEPIDLLGLTAEEAARNDLQVSGTPAYVLGDPPLMIRLIRNLIQNALKHGAPPIDIEVRSDGKNAELRVRDHGAGIAHEQVEKIFEPFYRPPGSSEASGGWGLGLSLVRQIAGHHGGWVKVEAPEGGGALFIVTLPAHEVE
ncbi:MAG TPA: HAMP domain-containing sensor histidine kinase [Rhizobiaceae bacterium]|nr:HAMP domain-containing sensor histidine kinase [Rhizobiaceae bacterium]